ncbi:hypothetical protein IWQ56_004617, partial [Coemansia nantahalensis]
ILWRRAGQSCRRCCGGRRSGWPDATCTRAACARSPTSWSRRPSTPSCARTSAPPPRRAPARPPPTAPRCFFCTRPRCGSCRRS